MDNIFVSSIDKKIIKFEPSKLTPNYQDDILNELNKLYNGKCSNNGFIKPNSIKIRNILQGEIEKFSFKGYINFEVEFYLQICKIPNNIHLVCDVVEQNDFGFKCNFNYFDNSLNTNLTICEVYIPRNASVKISSNVNLSTINTNDKVLIEILRSDFSIGESTLRAVGKILKKIPTNYNGNIYINNINNNDINNTIEENDSDIDIGKNDDDDIQNTLSSDSDDETNSDKDNDDSDNEDDENEDKKSKKSDEENSNSENEDDEDDDNEKDDIDELSENNDTDVDEDDDDEKQNNYDNE